MHRFTRSLLLTSALTAFASPALAQQPQPQDELPQAQPATEAQAAPTQDSAAPPAESDDIVVTGTRAAGRTRLDSASPVDVLSGASLQRQGTTEVAAALANVAPSVNFPRAAATDATDAVRPATLRGLSPDQTLVLINGVRGHASAQLNTNGSVGRGSSAVDLNTIPVAALDRVEVLRDGASAQYGSDAIAGVVNLRLREARSGGGATVTYGFYDTDIDTARGSRHVTGENNVTASAWQGIGFGSDGFLTLSGEYNRRQPTNRADFDPRVTPTRVTGRFGDPALEQYTLFANAGASLTDKWSLYGWVGYQDRDVRGTAFPRLPGVTSGYNVNTLYPNGFLPVINTKSTDLNSALGVRGEVAGWNVDLNVSYGRNRLSFRTRDSANFAAGNASQTDFFDGRLIYDQWVAGLDVARKFDLFQSLNVAFGLEGRREGYKIEAGEPAGQPVSGVSAGAQGFPALSQSNALERSRRNGSAYLDIEAQLTDALLLGLAGRFEDYSDFGSTANGKASLRYDIADWLALRGTVSTGFRAPSLQQQFFTSTASVVQNGVPFLTITTPSTSGLGNALGGVPLDPEKSTNFSAGTVIRFGGFDLSVDGYYIKLRDQLALSENINASFSPGVAALLNPYGVTAARFFINGVRSTTQGIDAVAHYRLRTARVGAFDVTLAGNVNKVKVTDVPTSTATLNPAPTLFARSRVLTVEQGTPGEKVTGTIDWSLDQVGALARVTYYGDVNQPGSTLLDDVRTGRHAVTDLEVRYQALPGGQVALGVSNLFDVYPDRTIPRNNSTGVIGFPYYSPFGFNGRFLYVRAGLSW
ncbi:TonB-dependent receptor plug domain-containing protein [Sphingomonas sp. DT-51]|uniref:TonB-dependent receptor plug domain-containing protein n=1 Tax=Sphingomonas sp. DT-51 TaxID=3396165 RepID=UPI003F1C8657